MSRLPKEERHKKFVDLIEADPFVTDETLSETLGVSIQTIRLDRMALGIPELRSRIKDVARINYDKVRTLKQYEIVGELIDLELNRQGISLLQTDEGMAFERTRIVKGHYIFAMAESLALAVIDAEVAITGVANLKYGVPVKSGDQLKAKAKVTMIRGSDYFVHVFITVKDQPVFRSKFIMKTL